MARIFISHAEADKPLVDEMFDLLQTGADVRTSDMFCSSVEGAGIRTGEDFVKWIHAHLSGADMVLLIVTPNYMASRFCVAEMGAAWALEKKVFPIVLPDMPRELRQVMLGKHTAALNTQGLDDLRDAIEDLGISDGPTARWTVKRDQCLSWFAKNVESLPSPECVSREQFDEEVQRTEAAIELNGELREQVRQLQTQCKRLEEAKDREEVRAIRREFSSELEEYQSLTKEAADQLKDLPTVVVRCLFSRFAGRPWRPHPDDAQYYRTDIEKALDSQWIHEVGAGGEYEANVSHPRLRDAYEALNDLGAFIEEDLSAEGWEQLADERRWEIGVANREYWEEELYGASLLD